MIQRTHCVLYIPIDRQNMDERGGNCLDQPKTQGVYYPCMEVIEAGRCCKNRKSPVL